MMRRPWFRFTLLAAFSFLLGFSYHYHLPKIEAFLLVEVERLSQKHSPVRIWAQDLDFHLLPLGIVLRDVRVLPKPPLDRYLAPARLKEAGARIAIFPLLRGELRLSQAFIRDSEVNLFLRPELFEKKGEVPTRFDFNLIYGLPIDEILLERVQLQGRLEPQNVVFRVSDFDLLVGNRYRSLLVELNAPRVLVKPSGPLKPLNIQLELRTLVEAQEMQVSAFKLKADDSFVVASGRANGDFSAGKVDNAAFDARAKLLLSDLNIWEEVFLMNKKLPRFEGRAEVDVGFEIREGKGYLIDADLNTADLKIDKFLIGQIQGHVSSDLKSVRGDQLMVSNHAGRVRLKKYKVDLEPKPSFTTQVSLENVELRTFLNNLGIKRVPLDFPFNGDGTCSGLWGDNPEATCKGKLSSPRLWVHTGKPKEQTIIEVLDLRGEGEAKATLKQVEFKGNLQGGKNSRGSAHGTAIYTQGFKVFYEGENVDFADVKNLSNMKFGGQLKVSGSTQGNSDAATLEMDVKGKDVWVEDYPLGDLGARITYKTGHLRFDGAQGQYGVTRYTGDLDLNLVDNRLAINMQIPFADLKDIKNLFQRKFDLPIEVSGTGQGQLQAEGPFQFNQLSYTLRSSFYRGQITEEAFDELVFNVHAKDGMVSSDRIHITKANGVADIKGKITPSGEIDTVVVGRGMRLEQSENVTGLGFDLQGQADFTMLIRGQLPKPRIELNGRLSRVVLADQPAEDSVFKLSFLSDRMEGSGQFLGSKLLADFVFPYTEQAPFSFKMKATKWDFTNLFSLVSRTARQLEFNTSVTMDISLNAPTGGFWASSGQVEISEFNLRKGLKSMSAEKPMYLFFRDGLVNSRGFGITSGDSYLKLDVANLQKEQLNASLNGKLDLSLLGLFTPFITDLRGAMALSMDLRGSLANPDLSGSAYIEKGYAKFAEFVHPFSNVRADLLFNDNQIIINTWRSDLAGGRLNADGRITFAGNTRPIEAKGTFTDVKLNVPEGFRTAGSGSVAVRGDGFPYTMDIVYTVTGGEVVYEFGADGDSGSKVKASTYLPKFLNQEVFHPFTFLVDVTLKNAVTVNNSLVQAQVTGAVKAAGTPDRILLTGTVNPVAGGKVFFNETPFEIASSFVEYNNAPPAQPKIYLTANARVTENVQDENLRTSEQQYDVNLLVQGRGPVPEILLTSQPPLTQRQIISLLALGVTTGASGDNLNQANATQTSATATSTAVGAALLQRAGGRKIKDTFGVDVRVSSQQQPLDNAASPKVTFSKQWTPKFGASASSTLQANPNNDVRLEYKLNRKTSVIGYWEGREQVNQQLDANTNVFGLDLEYKVQFK